MSEKQLTVAELLAREAAKKGGTDAPRRRRRRSLEDGGVSVAELTGSLPRVEAKPEEPRHTSEPIDEPKPVEPKPETPESTPAPSAPKVSVLRENDPIKLTTDSFPAQQAQKAPEHKAPSESAPTEVAQQASESEAEQTAQLTAVKEPQSARTTDAEDTGVIPAVVEEPTDVEKLQPEEDEDDERVSLVSVLLMIVIGLCVGAAIFLGFRELWANANSILVGALAGVMTLGIVGLVHALRTERDGLSMTLAAITGLAVTFGPLLVVGL